jgi:hypothetical protein
MITVYWKRPSNDLFKSAGEVTIRDNLLEFITKVCERTCSSKVFIIAQLVPYRKYSWAIVQWLYH